MFYQKGIDITNDKQMFNFLKNHYEYYTMSSWNRLSSIANNVKLYNLALTGDWVVAHNLLAAGEYDTLNYMIQRWLENHKGYEVFFNGRSGGYLVLRDKGDNGHILPDEIIEAEDYNEYKRWCREYYGSVKANRDTLVYYTKLVQDFDKLCDELREFVNELSMQTFEVIEMQRAVAEFNLEYEADLDYLGFSPLSCDSEGNVDLSEVLSLHSLTEAFLRTVKHIHDYGYRLMWSDSKTSVRIIKKY